MMIPGILAQRRAAGGQAVLWTPLNMATVPPLYLDAHDGVITSVSGFASTISNLGAMGSSGDFAQADSTRRPSILNSELSGKRVLRFDGTSDWMQCDTAAIRDIFRARNAAWSFVVYKKRAADVTPTNRVLFHFLTDSGTARFTHWCGSGSAGKANVPYVSFNASGFATVQGNTASVGSYAFSSADLNLTAGTVALHLNGVLDASSSAPIGSFPDTSAAGGAFPAAVLGARGDAVWMPDIDLAACVVGNTALSASDRQRLEGWAAHKYGLTGNLPANHPYKTAAPTV